MSLVKDYMMRTLNSISINDTLKDAIRFMCKREMSVMPVVDDSNKFIGTIYSQNILKNVLPEQYGYLDSNKLFYKINQAEEKLNEIKNREVQEYMTTSASSVRERDKMDKIVQVMLDNQESYLFVTNENGNLRGYISRADLLLYLLEETEKENREM